MAPAASLETRCPKLYHRLPDPDPTMLLSYNLWVPGFEWKPEPEPSEFTATETETATTYSSAEQEVALHEMVEENELQRLFKSAKGGSNISTLEATDLARKMGLAPSKDDASHFKEEYGDSLNYDLFQKFLVKVTHPEDDPEALAHFFEYYDSLRTGTLTKKQMRNLLKTWGDPLTDAEVDATIRDLAGNSDVIEYKTFIQRVLQK